MTPNPGAEGASRPAQIRGRLIARRPAIRTIAPTVAVTRLPMRPVAASPIAPNKNPPRIEQITPMIRSVTRLELPHFLTWLASHPAARPINRNHTMSMMTAFGNERGERA